MLASRERFDKELLNLFTKHRVAIGQKPDNK